MNALTFLYRAAQFAPGRVAVAHPGGQINYTELLARVNALAARLPAPFPDGAGEPIAVVAEHDHQVPELYLGVMARGHAVLPISSRLPEEAIARIAAKARVRLGLLAPSAARRVRPIAQAADATRWMVYGSEDAVGSLPDHVHALPSGTAMVCYTSGTTGEPKGVMITHTNLVVHGLTFTLVLDVKGSSVHINPMPLAHITGAVRAVSTLVNAGTNVILPGFDPKLVFESVVRWRGTHIVAVPTMVKDMLAIEPERYDLDSLQVLGFGTAPMPMPVIKELMARLKCGLFNGYGSTESSALAVGLDPAQHVEAVATGDEELLGSVGRAVPGVEIQIFDDENRILPQGESGQVALRGAKISPGYLDNPGETSAKFLPDGWLLTGDQGRLIHGGNLVLLGRRDEMIITGGLNVQPAEIENEALRFKGIAECAAFGVRSERWGQEVHLAVVGAPGVEIDAGAMREYLRTRVDPYKLPKKVHVVAQLPRSNIGKVQRFRLPDQLALRTSEN